MSDLVEFCFWRRLPLRSESLNHRLVFLNDRCRPHFRIDLDSIQFVKEFDNIIVEIAQLLYVADEFLAELDVTSLECRMLLLNQLERIL